MLVGITILRGPHLIVYSPDYQTRGLWTGFTLTLTLSLILTLTLTLALTLTRTTEPRTTEAGPCSRLVR